GINATPTALVGELKYGNGAFVMTILVPRSGESIEALAASLDTTTWNASVSDVHETETEVRLPRIRLEYARTLNEDLEALGMVTPFGAADFSRMSVAEDLAISLVRHKTFVDVNEE